jgi:hypothetical protein
MHQRSKWSVGGESRRGMASRQSMEVQSRGQGSPISKAKRCIQAGQTGNTGLRPGCADGLVTTSRSHHTEPETRGMNVYPINATCPRSGKPIVPECHTQYRGCTVTFCNLSCRDHFAAHIEGRPKDREFFDAILQPKRRGRTPWAAAIPLAQCLRIRANFRSDRMDQIR